MPKAVPSIPVEKQIGFLPLGRKFHWKPLAEKSLTNTVWEDVKGFSGDGVSFEDLKSVFSAELTPAAATVAKESAPPSPSVTFVTLIDPKRAQNVGVVLARLPLEVLLPRLLSLDADGLSIETLERLKTILPSDEEVHAFNACPETAHLRDIERKLRPIYLVKRLAQRIRILMVQLQLEQTSGHCHGEITILRKASDEVKESVKLRKLLHLILLMGNYVNFGSTDLNIRGFSLETLQKLLEFRSSNDSSITTLHFLAAKVVDSQRDLVSTNLEMPSLGLACRIGQESIQQAISSLKVDAAAIAAELTTQSKLYDDDALARLTSLGERVNEKLAGLTEEWQIAEAKLIEVRKFFGEDPRKCAPEDFFTALRQFIDSFTFACNDLIKHPKKLAKIISK